MVVPPTSDVGQVGVRGLQKEDPGFSLILRSCCFLSPESLGNLKLTPKSHTHLASNWNIKHQNQYRHVQHCLSPAWCVLGVWGMSFFPDTWAPNMGHPNLPTCVK